MSSPLPVCHLIHSLGAGGAEHLLVDLAAVAPAAGLRVSVVSLTRPSRRSYISQLEALGAEVRTLPFDRRWDPRALGAGLAASRELGPAVVHSHLKHADLVGAHVSRRTGIPMVSTLHLIEDDVTGAGRLKRQLAARARDRHARRIIAVSDAQRRWYLRTFPVAPGRVVTVRNGVRGPGGAELAAAPALRAEWGAGAGTVLAVMVGIMRQGKGHEQLLEAAARLRHERLRFVLVGDGECRPALESLARGRGLDNVVFAGFRDDVGAVLAAADLVVHPTRFDALPTALIHALAAGRPTVATDVGGVGEVVGDDCGVLVPPGDADLLAKAIADLAGDPERRDRMGARARRRFTAEFAAEAWAARLRRLYDEVLEEAGG